MHMIRSGSEPGAGYLENRLIDILCSSRSVMVAQETKAQHDECECCECHGHEWISLDRGETIECRYCDADITEQELQTLFEVDYE